MSMLRVFEIPLSVPDGAVPLIMVFGKTEQGTTQLFLHASENMLTSLRRKSVEDRVRISEDICSNITNMLLQYSS